MPLPDNTIRGNEIQIGTFLLARHFMKKNAWLPDKSVTAFALLVGYMVWAKAYTLLFPASFRSVQQMAALDWPFIALWAMLGAAGLFFYQQCQFPRPGEVSKRMAWLYPALAGVALGLLSIVNDQLTDWTGFVETKMNIPSIHISFPQSIVIYPAGAIVHEIFNRIFLLSFACWIGMKLSRSKTVTPPVFWVSAILTSLIEPAGSIGLMAFSVVAAVSSFCVDFLINLTQAWFMTRAGFVAAVVCRVGLYLVWHVAYGWVTSV